MALHHKTPDLLAAESRAESLRHRFKLDLIAEGLPEKTAAEFARRNALAFMEGAAFAASRQGDAAARAVAGYSAEMSAIEAEMPGDGSACGRGRIGEAA